jgi:hypothetical protein
MRAIPDQIRIIGRDRGWVARWLNITCVYSRITGDFLLQIADRDVERGAGQKVGTGVVKARLGQLPVCGSAREMRKGQGRNNHDKSEDYDERSAFGCAIRRMKEFFHRGD